ncbi:MULTISPECIES: hypothetical protein [unclassified Bradyrhizobium]|uniref:hypothetical protein n=1 Tax=unclassified Bradyrhizobium TaxID=2631580 RepID=UPI002FF099A4
MSASEMLVLAARVERSEVFAPNDHEIKLIAQALRTAAEVSLAEDMFVRLRENEFETFRKIEQAQKEQ